MRNSIKEIIYRIKTDNKRVFYIICILFSIMLSFIQLYGDDITGMRVENGSIVDYWKYSVYLCSIWTSRLFVNFVIFLFSDNRYTFIWAAYMGLSLYVLMYSFSKLFAGDSSKECNLVIASIIMLFPWHYLNSAGWIATLTTYLSPTAFGFFSLIPIKKYLCGQKLKWWEGVVYSLALIYGANLEQMMVVILGSYTAAVVYFAVIKKKYVYLWIQLILSFASCLMTILSPGNFIRKKDEIINWYKSWDMLNKIDKVDLGYSTTMQWLLFGSHIFMIAICCLFTFIIWKKYKRLSFLSIAGVPTLLVILLGPLRSITVTMYPNIKDLTDSIEKNGLVTVANRGNLSAFSKYMIWAAMIILLCMVVVLLQDSIRMLIVSFVLICTGGASRVVMGFSPTIYASGPRTFAVMVFCIMGVACCTYSNSIKLGYINKEDETKISVIANVLLLFSMINILLLVAKV